MSAEKTTPKTTAKKSTAKETVIETPTTPTVVETPKQETFKNYRLSDSTDVMNLANEVAQYIKHLRLFQNIQGKEYVNVEGWQYAGSRLGIVPVVQTVVNMSDSTEIKYSTTVQLFDLATQQIVGAGFAICSNKEQGRKYYQEYAIASMSQTRAVGKAFRNILAWIIRAAGYEPTPAEEMDYQGNTATNEAPKATQAPANAQASQKTANVQQAQAQTAKTPAPAPINTESNFENEGTQQNAEPEPEIKYATAKQKEEIIRLLNKPVITRQEKTKMLLNINKLDVDRAAQSIEKLKKVIEERENELSASINE